MRSLKASNGTSNFGKRYEFENQTKMQDLKAEDKFDRYLKDKVNFNRELEILRGYNILDN